MNVNGRPPLPRPTHCEAPGCQRVHLYPNGRVRVSGELLWLCNGHRWAVVRRWPDPLGRLVRRESDLRCVVFRCRGKRYRMPDGQLEDTCPEHRDAVDSVADRGIGVSCQRPRPAALSEDQIDTTPVARSAAEAVPA